MSSSNAGTRLFSGEKPVKWSYKFYSKTKEETKFDVDIRKGLLVSTIEMGEGNMGKLDISDVMSIVDTLYQMKEFPSDAPVPPHIVLPKIIEKLEGSATDKGSTTIGFFYLLIATGFSIRAKIGSIDETEERSRKLSKATESLMKLQLHFTTAFSSLQSKCFAMTAPVLELTSLIASPGVQIGGELSWLPHHGDTLCFWSSALFVVMEMIENGSNAGTMEEEFLEKWAEWNYEFSDCKLVKINAKENPATPQPLQSIYNNAE